MIKAFLIRQPPDTPAVLVCTAAVGGLCAADQDLLSVPTPVRPNNRPTRSSSVGVKSSPRELSALSTTSAPHLVRRKGESLFPRPPLPPSWQLRGGDCSGRLPNHPQPRSAHNCQCLCVSRPTGWGRPRQTSPHQNKSLQKIVENLSDSALST